jgi:hypothetical protein
LSSATAASRQPGKGLDRIALIGKASATDFVSVVIAILVARGRWTDTDTERFGPKYHAAICHWAVEIAEALKAKEKVDAGFK